MTTNRKLTAVIVPEAGPPAARVAREIGPPSRGLKNRFQIRCIDCALEPGPQGCQVRGRNAFANAVRYFSEALLQQTSKRAGFAFYAALRAALRTTLLKPFRQTLRNTFVKMPLAKTGHDVFLPIGYQPM